MGTFHDYFDYRKDDATKGLKINLILSLMNINIMSPDFTRFYQGYILPKKFE